MPILAVAFPAARATDIASLSLAAVFFNAASGTLGYARMKRIDYRAGTIFALASIPGAIGGSIATRHIERSSFDFVLGLTVIVGAAFLFIAAQSRRAERLTDSVPPPDRRRLILGTVISVAVGFLSSFLGIGGGIIHVPAMVMVLDYPVHIGTATSHFVLAVSALAGTLIHLFNGEYHGLEVQVLALAVGMLAGAQVGARLSTHVPALVILRVLAVALALVGVRIIADDLAQRLEDRARTGQHPLQPRKEEPTTFRSGPV